jgi:hypothetical protein
MYTGKDPDSFHAWTMMAMGDVKAEADVSVHPNLIRRGLYPAYPAPDHLFVRNYGEQTALRGGSWLDGNSAGLWELYLRDTREWRFPDVGFRAAYVEV